MANISAFLQGILPDCSDVDIFDRCVRKLFRIIKSGEAIQAVIGNLRDSDVRFAWVGVCLSRQVRLGQDLKQMSCLPGADR